MESASRAAATTSPYSAVVTPGGPGHQQASTHGWGEAILDGSPTPRSASPQTNNSRLFNVLPRSGGGSAGNPRPGARTAPRLLGSLNASFRSPAADKRFMGIQRRSQVRGVGLREARDTAPPPHEPPQGLYAHRRQTNRQIIQHRRIPGCEACEGLSSRPTFTASRATTKASPRSHPPTDDSPDC